jgi:prepilin-type processing-associated H-X9-DG protein
VLVALLLPVVITARDQAQQAACMGTLRNLGIALRAYVDDSEGAMPVQTNDTLVNFGDNNTAPNWLRSLAVYVDGRRQVFYCPSAAIGYWTGWNPTATSDTNYMANQAMLGRRITRIPNSSQYVFAQEHWQREDNAWLRPRFNYTDGAGKSHYNIWHDSTYYGFEIYEALHRKGTSGNLMFLDGHVETRAYKDLRSSDFGLTPDNVWNINGSYTNDYTCLWQ